MSSGELAGDAGMKTAMNVMDRMMEKKGVSKEVRENVINAAEMMYEFIPYAVAQRENPTDGKVLAKFLALKGTKVAKMFGNESVNCAIAIVDFLLATQKAAGTTATGFPPALALAYGLALIDLIDVGNSCEFAQLAYYEAFLRTSQVKLMPVRVRMEQYYSSDKAMCVAP
jgi:hypothetical protein